MQYRGNGVRTLRFGVLALLMAFAAGSPAAAQSTPPQPVKPPPTAPSGSTPATQPPPTGGQTKPGQTKEGQTKEDKATQDKATQDKTSQDKTSQDKTSAAPEKPLPAVPASRKFTSDSGIMFSVIYANKTADYEAVLGRVKEALTKSQDPKKKQMALGWRVLKGLEAGPGGNVVYVWFFDPPVKDEDYSITLILAEAFPSEAQDLWAKYTACFVSGQVMLNLQQVLTMGPTGTVTVPK